MESEYYLSPEPSMDEVTEINQKVLEQRLEDMCSRLEKLNESFTSR